MIGKGSKDYVKTLLLSFLVTTSLTANAKLIDKVIYGTDDRVEVYQSPDSLMRELARGVAVQVSNSNVVEKPEWTYKLKTTTMANFGICLDTPYVKQPKVGDCTAFLIAPDKMLTAAHCISSSNQCKNNLFVFDFAYDDGREKDFVFNETQVARCRSVIERVKNPETGVDYAVLLLDRKMENRPYLKVRKEGKVEDDAILTVIGHPMGIPAKITSGAEVRENSDPYFFKMNSDTFHGNSGSPVINTRTGIVEGILVRGDTDFVVDKNRGCLTQVVHPSYGGGGEDVVRVNIIEKL